MSKKELSWGKCFLWGILITPLTMVLIYLVLGFLPDKAEQWVHKTLHAYPFSVGLVFYLCGVIAYRWIALDLSKKEDWPDSP